MNQNVDNPLLNVENSRHHMVWNQCLGILKKYVNPQSFQTWFLPIRPVKIENNVLTVEVPSQFFYEWLEEHYPTIIRKALAEILGEKAVPEYIIRQEPVPKTQPTIKPSAAPQKSEDTFLNYRYTFETFVEGNSNQFAKAAALAVGEAPGATSFNPLVVYGGVGLGKTHLIQAIGNHTRKNQPALQIKYVSSEKFTIDFINSIQNNKTNQFSQFYRNTDLLLVDDIQFFMSKERTQEEFFHTFNSLHQKGKQIVLTSDRPPKELSDLEERLLSRFQWGLIADVKPPDLETRIAILQQKAELNGIDLSMDIIEYIASNIMYNIRELEGSLVKLLAFSSLRGVDINLEIAKQVLKDIVVQKKKNISIEDIQRSVCRFYNIPDDLLRGKSRKKEIAFARQVAMYLSKELTNCSLKSIGLHFGGRDHTTVIHAIRTIKERLKNKETDGKLCETIDNLKRNIETASL
ncbi:MAG: chromosomal replication initiator protein DnaA [bacterium]